jgi:hypothetical protein
MDVTDLRKLLVRGTSRMTDKHHSYQLMQYSWTFHVDMSSV